MLKLRLYFCDSLGDRFWGEGPYQLLLGVKTHGSLRASAQHMNMAYTKALGMIKRAEDALGFPLTQRTIGGKGGGGSRLTIQAEEWMHRYETYQKKCYSMALQLYQTEFPEL